MRTQRTPRQVEFETLFDQARAGDQDAARLFVQRYSNCFLKVVRQQMDRQLRNLMDAEDLMQDFYMKVLGQARGHRPGAWMPYLQVVAKNVAREASRKQHAAKRDVSRNVELDANSLKRIPAAADPD